MQGAENTINSKKLLDAGKLITMRKHTRFIDFPQHTHDYVELVYMCQGSTTHIVDDKEIELCQGELLFLGQGASHSIKSAKEDDIAVNFIILPHFFADTLPAIGEEETPLKTFLINCLCGKNNNRYLHYKVSKITEIQNLIENLLLIVMGDLPNKRKQSQMTMALLLMQLMVNTESLAAQTKEDAAVIKLLDYIETNYIDGSFADATKILHYEASWLSREILKKTGKTYTELVQEKRLLQAAFLLKNTTLKVSDISVSVGYENISYFHRKFAERFNMSPREYRLNA
jgi:AraC-like DNA-binding protein